MIAINMQSEIIADVMLIFAMFLRMKKVEVFEQVLLMMVC